MRRVLLGVVFGLSVAVVAPWGGTSAAAQSKETTAPAGSSAGTYELLFREGVLDAMAEDAVLDYAVHRTGWSAPRHEMMDPAASTFDGAIILKGGPDDSVTLSVERGEQHSPAGTFPRSVGNPIIMYFMESVLRDMANQAGGSPFYIRNRLKAALLEPGEVRPLSVTLGGKDVQAREVTLHPFANDKARARMHGFADLEVVAVLSDEVPGWYVSLSAKAPAVAGSTDSGYSNVLTLDPETM